MAMIRFGAFMKLVMVIIKFMVFILVMAIIKFEVFTKLVMAIIE